MARWHMGLGLCKSSNVAYQMMTCSFQLTVSGRHLLCSRASAKVKVARAPRHTTMTMAAKLKEILVLSLFCRRRAWACLGSVHCKSWQMQHYMRSCLPAVQEGA